MSVTVRHKRNSSPHPHHQCLYIETVAQIWESLSEAGLRWTSSPVPSQHIAGSGSPWQSLDGQGDLGFQLSSQADVFSQMIRELQHPHLGLLYLWVYSLPWAELPTEDYYLAVHFWIQECVTLRLISGICSVKNIYLFCWTWCITQFLGFWLYLMTVTPFLFVLL